MRYQLPRGYRRYLLGLAMLALLCIAAAVTVFFVPVQKQQPQAQYLLKDNAGRLALYTPDGTGPLAQYDVYTRLLPEPDCLALQQGVSIYTEAELQQKLEASSIICAFGLASAAPRSPYRHLELCGIA